MKNLLFAFFAVALLASCGMDPAENPVYKEAMSSFNGLQDAYTAQETSMGERAKELAGYTESLKAMAEPDSAYAAAVNMFQEVATKEGAAMNGFKEKIAGYKGLLAGFLTGETKLDALKEMATGMAADMTGMTNMSTEMGGMYTKIAGMIASAKAAMETKGAEVMEEAKQ